MKFFKKMFSFFWDKSLLIFAIIGGINTIVSTAGSVWLTNNVGWNLFFAQAFMFAVCSIASFYFNRKYSFESKEPLGPSILRFSIVVTVCFLLSYGIKELVVPWLHNSFFPNMNSLLYLFIQVICVQVIFTVLNYVGQRMWAFKSDKYSKNSENATKDIKK